MDYNESNCPFCHLPENIEVICENDLARATIDIYPVSEGHSLVIPKRHFSNYFDITKKEYLAVFELINSVKEILDKRFSPDGYNIGVNIGMAAGQTVPHCHFHIIPRYYGDMDNPRGGVRHVIPEKGKY